MKRVITETQIVPKRAKTVKTKRMPLSINPTGGKRVGHIYHHSSNTTGPSGGGNVELVFRGNGLYDPDTAIGGTQPYGRDQMAAMYYRNFVINGKIRVRATTTGVTDSLDRYVLVWASPIATAVGANNKTAWETCLASGGRVTRIGANYHQNKDVMLSASTKRMIKRTYIDHDACGTGSSDPVTEWYWHVCVVDNQTGGTAATVYFEISIHYDTYWFEPIPLGAS